MILLTIAMIAIQMGCSKVDFVKEGNMTFDKKKTLKFEKAVFMDRDLKLVKKLLADPECDVAYENGKILSLAIRYRSEEIICLLANNSRLKNALESQEVCEQTCKHKKSFSIVSRTKYF